VKSEISLDPGFKNFGTGAESESEKVTARSPLVATAKIKTALDVLQLRFTYLAASFLKALSMNISREAKEEMRR